MKNTAKNQKRLGNITLELRQGGRPHVGKPKEGSPKKRLTSAIQYYIPYHKM